MYVSKIKSFHHQQQGFSMMSVMLSISILSVVSFSTIMLSKKDPVVAGSENIQSCQAAVKYIANTIIGTPAPIKSYIPFNPIVNNNPNADQKNKLKNKLKFSNLMKGNKLIMESENTFSGMDDTRLLTGVTNGPPYTLNNGLLLSGKIRALTAFHNETKGSYCGGLKTYENSNSTAVKDFLKKFKLRNSTIKLQISPYKLTTDTKEIDCDEEKLLIIPQPREDATNAITNLKSKTRNKDLLEHPDHVRNDLGMRVKVAMSYVQDGETKECNYSKDYFQPRDIHPPKITGLYLVDNFYTNSVDGGGTPVDICHGQDTESMVTIALAVQKGDLESGTVYMCKDLSGPIYFGNTATNKPNNPPLLWPNGNFAGYGGWISSSNPNDLSQVQAPQVSYTLSPVKGNVVNPWGSDALDSEWVPCEQVTMCGEKPIAVDLNSAADDLFMDDANDENKKLENITMVLRYKIPSGKYCAYDMAAVAVDVAGNMSTTNNPTPPTDSHGSFTRLTSAFDVNQDNNFIKTADKNDNNNNNLMFTSFKTMDTLGKPGLEINSEDRPFHSIDNNMDRDDVMTIKNDNKYGAKMKAFYNQNFNSQNIPNQYKGFGRISKYAKMAKMPPLGSYFKVCSSGDANAAMQAAYPNGYLSCSRTCCILPGQCAKPDPPTPPIVDPVVPDPPIVTPSVVVVQPPPPPPPPPVIPPEPPPVCLSYKPGHYIPSKVVNNTYVPDYDEIANLFYWQARYRPDMDVMITSNRWRMHMRFNTCDPATGVVGPVYEFITPTIYRSNDVQEFVSRSRINPQNLIHVDETSLTGDARALYDGMTIDPGDPDLPLYPAVKPFQFRHGGTYTETQIRSILGNVAFPQGNAKYQMHPGGGDHMDWVAFLDGNTTHRGSMGQFNCADYAKNGWSGTPSYTAYFYKGHAGDHNKLEVYWACSKTPAGAKFWPLVH